MSKLIHNTWISGILGYDTVLLGGCSNGPRRHT